MANLTRLPGPMMDAWEWQHRGACVGLNPDIFFHPYGERAREKRQRAQDAKQVCATCQVKEECLDWALRVREPAGTWGGMSEDERHTLLHRDVPA
jgi:WhiB family redox-sensing transcriptional regulator